MRKIARDVSQCTKIVMMTITLIKSSGEKIEIAIAAAQCAHDRRAALMARQGAVTLSDLIGAALSVACSPYQRREARQP
jgi:hypothetical protein